MSKIFSIKLFVIALICFLSLNNIKEKTIQTKHTDTNENIVSVTDHFHFDSIFDYFELYTLTVSHSVMNIIRVIIYFDNQNEIKLINATSNFVSHGTISLDTS